MPNIVEITDLSAPELDVYARLTQAQLRNRLEPEKGIFIAESPKVITRALDAGYTALEQSGQFHRNLLSLHRNAFSLSRAYQILRPLTSKTA